MVLQLLVNYGIVEDDNPYDKLQLTATIPHSDPLFQVGFAEVGVQERALHPCWRSLLWFAPVQHVQVHEWCVRWW